MWWWVGGLFLVASSIGLWQINAEKQRLIEESLDSAYLSVAAYAQAAEQWLSNEAIDTLFSVSHIMLTGRTRFVEIRNSAVTLLNLSASSLDAEGLPAASDTITDTPQRSLLRHSSDWMIEIVVPINPSNDNACEVRVWMDAEPLRMHIAATKLKILAIALTFWLAISGLIFIRLRHQRGFAGIESIRAVGSSNWIVDSDSMRISLHGCPILLTPKQYSLLSLLILHERKIFSEEEILEAIWPHSSYADSNDIRQCVYKIRRRVAKAAPGAEACIVNEKGFGYRFDPSEYSSHPPLKEPSCIEAEHATNLKGAPSE